VKRDFEDAPDDHHHATYWTYCRRMDSSSWVCWCFFADHAINLPHHYIRMSFTDCKRLGAPHFLQRDNDFHDSNDNYW